MIGHPPPPHHELRPYGTVPVAYSVGFDFSFRRAVLSSTTARTSAWNARASTFCPSRMSIARLVFPSRNEAVLEPGALLIYLSEKPLLAPPP